MHSRTGQQAASQTVIAAALFVALAGSALFAATAKTMYTAAFEREQALRATWQQAATPTLDAAALKQARAIVAAYEALVRRYPTSGYCDNALWQAAGLAADIYTRAQQDVDRRTAVRLYGLLAREYPAAGLARKAPAEAAKLQAPAARKDIAPAAAPKALPSTPPPTPVAAPPPQPRAAEPVKVVKPTPAGEPSAPAPKPVTAPPSQTPAAEPVKGAKPAPQVATLRDIRRTVQAEVVRITIEFDREVTYREERAENPPRLFLDFAATAAPSVQDANWSYKDDIVRQIRVGRRGEQATRIVLDLDGVSRYTVVALSAPYRLLVDCERKVPAAIRHASEVAGRTASSAASLADVRAAAKTPPLPTDAARPARTAPSPARDEPADKPASPAADRNRVSMAHQLGLTVARIVIDPGHGGHDPGAEGGGLTESQIVLDIALRLEQLLMRQEGIEVVLTRRTDVYVALEDRTAIANRNQGDLFLSIHANANKSASVRGIESYFLNFAANPDAEAVAARENAASGLTMKSLPDIVKSIALNNKLEESRDFANLVQRSMLRRLRPSNKTIRDLGVKYAPFVVLIGATMPSVLAEVSFVTNRREGQLLNSEAYRQRIAEALAEAVVRYRKNLKTANIVAHPPE